MAESGGSAPPTGDGILKCPSCGEEVEREDDGTIPNYCDDCGGDMSVLSVKTICPDCQTPRKKKKDKYTNFCPKCRYDYVTETSSTNSNLSTGVNGQEQSRQDSVGTISGTQQPVDDASSVASTMPRVDVTAQAAHQESQNTEENSGNARGGAVVDNNIYKYHSAGSGLSNWHQSSQQQGQQQQRQHPQTNTDSQQWLQSGGSDQKDRGAPVAIDMEPDQTADPRSENFGRNQSSNAGSVAGAAKKSYADATRQPKGSSARTQGASLETQFYDIRQQFLSLSEEITQESKSAILTKEDKASLKEALEKANNIHKSHKEYLRAIENATESEKPKREKKLENSYNAFNNFVKNRSLILHELRGKLSQSMGQHFDPGPSQPKRSQVRRSYARKIIFRAVLGCEVEDYLKIPNAVSINVVGHSNFTTDWTTHATLRHKSDGIYEGVCETLRQRENELFYKYVVVEHTGKKQHYEQLYNHHTDRHLLMTGDDDAITVHDGAIKLKKDKSLAGKMAGKVAGMATKIISYFPGGASETTPTERLVGYQQMLPNWVEEITKATSIETLTQWVLDTMLHDYLLDTLTLHQGLFKSEESRVTPRQAYLSLLGLLHLGGLEFTNSSEITHYLKLLSATEVTMRWLALQLTDDIIGDLKELLLEFTDGFLSQMEATIVKIMRRASIDGKGRQWVLLIPVYHMIMGITGANKGTDDKTPLWWGTLRFDGDVQSLKTLSRLRNDEWKIYWAWLQPYYRACDLLSTTFLALLTELQFVDFLHSDEAAEFLAIDAVLACADHHVVQADKDHQHTRKLWIYKAVLNYLQGFKFVETIAMAQCLNLVNRLVRQFNTTPTATGTVELWSGVNFAIQINLLILELVMESEGQQQVTPQLGQSIIEFSDLYQQHLYRHGSYAMFTKYEVQDWSELFKCDNVPGERVKKWWMSKCQDSLAARLRKVNKPAEVLEVYFKEENRTREMDETVTVYVLSQIQRWIENGNADELRNSHIPRKQLCHAIDQIIAEMWKTVTHNDAMETVMNMLQWGGFICLYTEYQNLTNDLEGQKISGHSSKLLDDSVLSFESVVQELLDAEVSIHDFQELEPLKDNLLKMCQICTFSTRVQDVELAFRNRQKELNMYMSFVTQLGDLWQCCKEDLPAMPELDRWLEMSLKDITFNDRIDTLSQTVICNVISPAVRDMIPKYTHYKSKRIFLNMFLSSLAGVDNWDVVVNIFNTCQTEFDRLTQTLNDGSMDVTALIRLKQTYFEDNKDNLLRELPELVSDPETCQRRREEINILVELDQYYEGAQIMLHMREVFNLEGDFSDLKKVAQAKERTLMLKSISAQLISSARKLRAITESQQLCLKAFLECAKFVEWVRADVKKNEVNIFVNLARSAMEEDDLAADKARYLHAALTGYTPLLYDIEANTAISYTEFMELCGKVWKALDRNKELPQNLRDSARELEFYRKVKTHYQNVEMHSILQAKAINATGMYLVGNIHGVSKDFKTLENIVRLTCDVVEKLESGEVKKQRTYTYSEIRNLQSKLTLVTGEKQRDNMDIIQNFDEMRDAIENLGNAYIDIRREGCIQFDDLLVVVHCNPDHGTAVEIKLQSVSKTMYGRSKEKSALDHTQNIYAYLNRCAEQWRASMNEKRSSSKELNFFTTEQLVILRKELGLFSSSGDPRSLDKAVPLLAMIHTKKPEEILPILREYEREEEKSRIEKDNSGFKTYQEMDTEEKNMVEHVLEVLDVDKHVAVVAVNQLGDDVLEPERLDKWNEERLNDQKVNSGLSQTSEDLLKKIALSSRSAELIPQLEHLWNEFITLTSGSIKNFLGIPHLSHLLRNLTETSDAKKQTQRKIPTWLCRGKPLLLAVPEEDTYKMVLTIYEAAGLTSPKPTRNEVLVCNEKTRKEEVTLFMNRALNDSLSFYCMVNCHVLGFEVCRQIENRLSNMVDNTVDDYGIAFIYSEKAKDARIKAYLDKFLVRNQMISDMKKLTLYVEQILKLSQPSTRSAAEVDSARSKVRLIRSKRAGVGKSLQKENLCSSLRKRSKLPGSDITIPVYRILSTDSIASRLMDMLGNGYRDGYDTIHLDVAHEVETGVDELLFNLMVLGSLVNSEGTVWQARETQYYIIECMPGINSKGDAIHEVLELLPTTMCITPEEVVEHYKKQSQSNAFIGFDAEVLKHPSWQNVLRYLEAAKNNSNKVNDGKTFNTPLDALQLLTRYCGIKDPTWLELRHYVHFLSDQLTKVAKSTFCSTIFATELPGFKEFVVSFMISMAKDFGTRSLKIAEETPGKHLTMKSNHTADLAMKKTWEGSNYPYLFFNEDGESFTPLGFTLKPDGRNQYDLSGHKLSRALVDALTRNKLPLNENFDTLKREDKLDKLRSIMVKKVVYGSAQMVKGKKVFVEKPMFKPGDDPDPNYVLTMDNAKKIIAIHQRLRVNVPVIIMGETGCGKTKLIDFMSKLQVPSELKEELKTMVIVKIHGGTTEHDIKERVIEAESLAEYNQEVCKRYAAKQDSKQVPNVYTVLFLDEANTTEAIGLVKEILCDGRMDGKPLKRDTGLKIIAACNPYRCHSKSMIEKLKQAGLGYNVDDSSTKDKLGHIPMRHLVYRVQALPQSLLPLVWDFGTLTKEREYIEQMITKADENAAPGDIRYSKAERGQMSNILCNSQTFMRQQKDECSFVSLRDVARLLDVANWFFRHRAELFTDMDKLNDANSLVLPPVKRSVLLAIGVCYLARLENATRDSYSQSLSRSISSFIDTPETDGGALLLTQVELCQNFFVNTVVDPRVHRNIAKNKALKENVFMMIVCIENRIPLFVVGKPGSSKSLSKALVMEAMRGETSGSGIFRKLKETYTESFQCSRHATAADIVDVFRTCASYQKNQQDLSKFVSVVVLDEVGLAEDSENMPLKALHPLLEDGSEGTPETKCAFIGISNWALDPAKMNRGIFVQRGTPANNELEQIAREICRSDNGAGLTVVGYISSLAEGYLSICKAKKPEERDLTEFFGLRDFYSLMKMVVNFAKSTNGRLNRNQLEHSIKRNFGGFDPKDFNPMGQFINNCQILGGLPPSPDRRPPTNPIELIKAALSGSETALNGMESRYLLILTENLSVLNLVLGEFDAGAEVVFGSRFKDDVSYTQVCYNIFRIKMCMDKGTPVILLNLDDLYESLYDALNQYFTYLGNKKYVDLGLGTHRVKAFVADGFRLIVIADKSKVLSQFPIPLINRLEKHYVSATTMLSDDQREIQASLEIWMRDFVSSEKDSKESCPMLCEGCNKETLNQPFRMPCHKHHIGLCCKERMFRDGLPNTCPVRGCDSDIEIDGWEIDKQALENREYFENSTIDTCFIGYSSETTALVVKKVTTEVMSRSANFEDMPLLWRKVEEGCKAYLIQCATAESVLRLDKTMLKKESHSLQQTYITDQSHENLLEYLESQLVTQERKPMLMQITSFAEVMTEEDVDLMRHHLNVEVNNYTVVTYYLKDFLKESHFTKMLSSFYNRSSEKDPHDGVLIIQCEAANDCIELLDSVRYIIQRETKQSQSKQIKSQQSKGDQSKEEQSDDVMSKEEQPKDSKRVNHTVLLLSLSRGRVFNGYQGGEWRCIHIDDPRPPKFRLPSLRQCLTIKPSDLIADQLTLLGHPDFQQKQVIIDTANDNEGDDEFDDMPPLEDEDNVGSQEDRNRDAEDRIIEAEDFELNQMAEEDKTTKSVCHRPLGSGPVNILPFIDYCLPSAMSRIKCTRTLNGFNIMKELFARDEDFLRIFLSHVYSLMKEEEKYSRSQWVKTDAAKASHMKKSETLRHAVEDALERAFVPAIAAVTAFTDAHCNLQLLKGADQSMGELWRRIFEVCGREGLTFEDITQRAASKLPESYYIESEGFMSHYPFSWTVKCLIDRFLKLPENANINKDTEGRWLTTPLKQSPLGAIIMEDDTDKSKLHAYAADFLQLTCQNQTDAQQQLMERIMLAGLARQFPTGATLAHVHLVYDQLEAQISSMNEIFSLQITQRKEKLDDMVLQKIKEEEQRYEELLSERTGSRSEPDKSAPKTKVPDDGVEVEEPSDEDRKAKSEDEEVGADDIDLIFDVAEIEPPPPCDLLALEALIEDMSQVSLNDIKSKPEEWVNEIDQVKSLMERILNCGNDSPVRRALVGKKWCRLELQKLYVEHVVIPGPVENGKRDTYKVLSFMKHVKSSEFQREDCFNQVVGGLRMVIRIGIRGLYSNCPAACPACDNPLDSPARLPCGHLLCDVCSKQNKTCPAADCDKAIPEDYEYDPSNDNIDDDKLRKLVDLRTRLNKFFMHFVSEMVFTSEDPPEDGILVWLMECVTFREKTREFSVFYCEDVLDPTPVLRSFLLKLFLSCDNPQVETHLNQLMRSWKDNEPDLQVQKMAMLIDCYKDLYDHDLRQPDTEIANELVKMAEDIDVATEPTVQLLTAVAYQQCCLQQAASFVSNSSLKSAGTHPIADGLRQLIQASRDIDNRQISYYIMRQMLATEGESRIKDLINTPITFLVPSDVQESLQSFTVPDIFSVYGGDTYTQAKLAIDMVISESVTPSRLKAALEPLITAYQHNGRTLLHSFFARVTRTLTHANPVDGKICDEIAKRFNQSAADPLVKLMGGMLLTNKKACQELRLDQAKGLNMMMLVLNTLTSFQHGSATGILNPLTEIIISPDAAKDHLFPTMEDNLMELVYQNQIGRSGQTVPYKCPNGHLYYIGNCGRPYVKQRCPDCKAEIGGTFHIASAGNQQLDAGSSALKTQRGYILGSPGSRGEPARHRDLSMLSCAVMRCLTHLFMLTSALFNKSKVYQMIKPLLASSGDVASFLEAHIQKDLQHISACCNESTEDCILLMHELLDSISRAHVPARSASILSTMKERSDWEPLFDRQYIIPIFGENKVSILRRIKTALASNRPESLHRILSTSNQPLNTESLLASAGLWIYRRPLTLTSVINMLNSTNQDYPNLLHMVKNCGILTAVKYLPDILDLMSHLCKTYHSKYSRADAKTKSISELCKQPQVRKWIHSYVTAWNIAIHSACFNSSGQIVLLQDDPLLSDLLPDKHANIFSATTSNPRRLIDHLVTVHNGVIKEARPSIRLREISSYAMIKLASKEELLGLISSHVEYQLNAETREQTPTYDFPAAEREVFMKYVGQRRRIKCETEQLPSYMFQEDFNVLNQIEILSESQDRLSIEQRSAMSDSAGRTIQTLSTYIKDLMTIISYLSVMPHVDMNQSLGDFMKKTLELKKVPNYLKGDIQLRHVRSVWILLKHAQTDSFMRTMQEPFNDVDAEYNVEMSTEIKHELKGKCTYNSPRTRVLLEELFEYITIRLNKSVTANQLEADDGEMGLQPALEGFIALDYERYEKVMEDIPQLPTDLQVKHAPQAWQCIWKRFTSAKQSSSETTV